MRQQVKSTRSKIAKTLHAELASHRDDVVQIIERNQRPTQSALRNYHQIDRRFPADTTGRLSLVRRGHI